MIPEFENILAHLTAQLESIPHEPNSIQKCEKAVFICYNAIEVLQQEIKALKAPEPAELILIQKQYIPAIYSEYIYYAALHNQELNKPIGSRIKAYYAREQDRLEQFFTVYQEFLHYCRSGKTDMDELYFLPATTRQPLLIDYHTPLIPDPFCTPWSFLAAQSLAYERLLNETMQAQSNLEPNPHNAQSPDLIWTDTKTDMVELVYALFAAGTFNKGKASIAEVTRFLEKSFGVQMGNTSMIFQEILRRKRSIIFIEKLKVALDLYITNIEERHR